LSVNLNWEPIVLGGVLILAIAADRVRERFETRLRLRDAGGGDEVLAADAPVGPDAQASAA
jgi:hypothetical protein